MPLTPEETEYLDEESWDHAQKQVNERVSPLLRVQGLSITGRGSETFANRMPLC